MLAPCIVRIIIIRIRLVPTTNKNLDLKQYQNYCTCIPKIEACFYDFVQVGMISVSIIKDQQTLPMDTETADEQ